MKDTLEDAAVLNLRLSIRGFIFDILLSERRPERIVIVDAIRDEGRKPGEIFEVQLDNLAKEKADDFTFHRGPTSNLLKELRDFYGLEIVIIGCLPLTIPAEMKYGFSEPPRNAVCKAGELIVKR